MNCKRLLASVLSAALVFTALPFAAAADPAATRGEVCTMLLNAADAYHTGVQKSDILKGEPDGLLHEDRAVTRAEALVMLSRAFGTLPKPVGDNARAAYPASAFTDVPDWTKAELANVFEAGIVAGTSATTFSPDEPVTAAQMDLFIRRSYALLGTNPKDDFYAAVNKTQLETSVLKPGRIMGGTLYDLMDKSDADVAVMIEEIAKTKHPQGSGEQKIETLYNNAMNYDARNKAGIAPIQPYLAAIDNAKTLDELMAAHTLISKELGSEMLLGFGLMGDLKDSNAYSVAFVTLAPSQTKDFYVTDGGTQKDAYLQYLTTMLTLGGVPQAEAAQQAAVFYGVEKQLAPVQLDPQDRSNVDKIYNLYTMQQLRDLFPGLDLDAVFASSTLKQTDKIVVMDTGLTEAVASLFTNENLDTLKIIARLNLLLSYGGTLSHDFLDAATAYQQAFFGVEGSMTDAELTSQMVQTQMADYLGEAYVKRHFSAKAKADVEDMVADFISIYKERVKALDWMSETTKAKALRKLDTMKVKVGYPDTWRDDLKNVSFKSVADGSSYFENRVAISQEVRKLHADWQLKPTDKSVWIMNVYTVNACYSPSFNEILFPAGILQAPMYDVNASREQNLGAVGYIIAHEITHAFDNNGAKFDENGNSTDWWTPEDYAAFQKLCDEATAFYTGQEAIPGVACNGALTLSENIADLGATACIIEAAKKLPNPDYKALFESMARTWSSAASRDTRVYLTQMDVHAPDKLRVNRTVVNFDEFYKTFDIQPGDGMYVAPEDRVHIW